MDEDQLFMTELDEGLIGSSGGSGGLFKSPIGILTACSIPFLVSMVFYPIFLILRLSAL